jgi:hypothetical protein
MVGMVAEFVAGATTVGVQALSLSHSSATTTFGSMTPDGAASCTVTQHDAVRGIVVLAVILTLRMTVCHLIVLAQPLKTIVIFVSKKLQCWSLCLTLHCDCICKKQRDLKTLS